MSQNVTKPHIQWDIFEVRMRSPGRFSGAGLVDFWICERSVVCHIFSIFWSELNLGLT